MSIDLANLMQECGGYIRNPQKGLLSPKFKSMKIPYLDELMFDKGFSCPGSSSKDELNLLRAYYSRERIVGTDEDQFMNMFFEFPFRTIFLMGPTGGGKSSFLHWFLKIHLKDKNIRWGIINLIRTNISDFNLIDAVHLQLDKIFNHCFPGLEIERVLSNEISSFKKSFKKRYDEENLTESVNRLTESIFNDKKQWNMKRMNYISKRILTGPKENFNIAIDNIDNYPPNIQLDLCAKMLALFADKKFRLILPIRLYNSFHLRNHHAVKQDLSESVRLSPPRKPSLLRKRFALLPTGSLNKDTLVDGRITYEQFFDKYIMAPDIYR